MESVFAVFLKQDSSSQQRRLLYARIWGCGFRKLPRKRKSWLIYLYPRQKGGKAQDLRLELTQSEAVQDWRRT